MIIKEILFELRRIANALEVIADTKLEQMPKGQAPPAELFDTRTRVDDDEIIAEARLDARIKERMEDANKEGFFFEEDALPDELLNRL